MSQKRISELRERQRRAFDEANAVVQNADAMCRDLSAAEHATFVAKTEEFNRLGTQLRALESAEPGGRDPQEALAELAEKRYGPRPPDLIQQRLELQKRMGERTAEAIRAHDAQMRDRQLSVAAASMKQQQREAEWQASLDYHRRLSQLGDANFRAHQQRMQT